MVLLKKKKTDILTFFLHTETPADLQDLGLTGIQHFSFIILFLLCVLFMQCIV